MVGPSKKPTTHESLKTDLGIPSRSKSAKVVLVSAVSIESKLPPLHDSPCPFGHGQQGSRYGCDSCDLDHEFGKRKIGNFHCCACRAIFGKILEAYIRDVVESADVGDIDGDADDIFHFRAVGA